MQASGLTLRGMTILSCVAIRVLSSRAVGMIVDRIPSGVIWTSGTIGFRPGEPVWIFRFFLRFSETEFGSSFADARYTRQQRKHTRQARGTEKKKSGPTVASLHSVRPLR